MAELLAMKVLLNPGFRRIDDEDHHRNHDRQTENN